MSEEKLYKCHHCLDIGVLIRERKRSDGRALGKYGSPCTFCKAGEVQRKEWVVNGLMRSAQENEVAIRRLDRLMESDDAEAEAERWRSAARARQVRKEDPGPVPLGTDVKVTNVGNPTTKRTNLTLQEPS